MKQELALVFDSREVCLEFGVAISAISLSLILRV